MTSPDPHFDSVSFPGSMKAGLYTAQMGVSLLVSRESITLRSSGRSYGIDRQHFVRLTDTSIFGIFKRGIKFHHRQPGIPGTIVFYPSVSRDHVKQRLHALGWL